MYALTGWIPERISLREGFQREKEWRRISAAWGRGEVLVTLGTGEEVGAGLVPLHAYGVVGEYDYEFLILCVVPCCVVLFGTVLFCGVLCCDVLCQGGRRAGASG